MDLGGEEEMRLRVRVRGLGMEKLLRDRCGGSVLVASCLEEEGEKMRWKREKKQEKGRESGLQDGHARFGQTRVVDAVEKSLMVEKVESAKLEKVIELRGDF